MKPIIYQLLPRLFSNTTAAPVHNGSIEENGSGKLNDITDKALKSIKALGVTHVWYTGVIEHAHCTDYSQYGITPDNPHIVKGKAGSPYAITDYYDIDPDIAVDVPHRLDEFRALVKRTHDNGLKVIIDFVPNHVARGYHSDAAPAGVKDFGTDDDRDMFFSPSNNFYYITRQQFAPVDVDLGEGEYAYVEFPAKASGNDCFTAFPSRNDWYETVKLNYGIDPWNGNRAFNPTPDTWHKMVDILKYWTAMGVDGFRCDMAHMVPVEFWAWAIPQVRKMNRDIIFIAELYDTNIYRDYIYRGGFNYLYDKVNLYDTLRAIETHHHSAAAITNCWQTVDCIGANMLNFLENHDEHRFGSPEYAGNPARAEASLVAATTLSTGPMMIYMGQELGEQALDAEGYSGRDGRTTIFDYWSLPTLRRWNNNGRWTLTDLQPEEKTLRKLYARVLTLANEEASISRGNFYDLMYVNYQNPGLNPHYQYAYLRYEQGSDLILILLNFSDNNEKISINIPAHALEHFQLTPGTYDAVELLHGASGRKKISADQPFETDIKPHGAVIWKIKVQKTPK